MFLKEMKLKIVQLNSKCHQSNKMCVTADWNKKAKLSCIFFGVNFLKEMNVKMVQLNSHFFNKMSVWGCVCVDLKQKSQIEFHLFCGQVFLKDMDFKKMQLNSHFFNKMSVCVCVCVCVDLNKKPN